MKKLFFAICFNICIFGISDARITPISEYNNIKKEIVGNKDELIKEVDGKDFSEYLSDRIKKAQKVKQEDINRHTSVIESDVERIERKEREKGFFQRVYERAVKKISEHSDEEREDVSEEIVDTIIDENSKNFDDEIKNHSNDWDKSLFPTIKVLLPEGTLVDVPAIEHIPYLNNNIEILSNGKVKFEETIVVVANGKKLKSGLTKVLPSKVFNKKKKSQNIDYSIISVSVNDQPVDYRLAKLGDRVLMVPTIKETLPSGIYVYKFEYLADNLLLNDKDFYNFYWNVGGNGLNLIIDRTFIKLTTPDKNSTIKHNAMVGSIKGFYPNSVIDKEDKISYIYEAKIPVFIGTGIHLTADIDKKAFYSETLWQKFIRSFYNYGDIYISFIGLLVIMISFIVSWSYISKAKSRIKVTLNKTSSMIRYFLYDKFDKKSVGGFLLDLYKRNIIDIQQAGETILLIKSTDNLKSLSLYEKKALKNIFPSHETTFSVTKNNRLPLKRFIERIGNGIKRDMLKFKIKLNLGYLLLNIAIMMVVYLGISSFKINAVYTFEVVVVNTLICSLGIMFWYIGSKKWQKFIAKCFSISIILFTWIIYSAVVHPLAALFLIWCIILIFYSLKIYSGRNGLLIPFIQDIIKQKEHLLSNKDIVSLSKGFLKYQSFIYVCDIENEIKPIKEDDNYKISIIKNIIERL